MKAEAKFDTWKEVSGRCPQCNWPWSFKGWDNSKSTLLSKLEETRNIGRIRLVWQPLQFDPSFRLRVRGRRLQ